MLIPNQQAQRQATAGKDGWGGSELGMRALQAPVIPELTAVS